MLRSLGAPCLHVLAGTNSDSGRPAPTASFEGIDAFALEKDALFEAITECRVYKTAEELEIMRYANKISAAAHVEMMRA